MNDAATTYDQVLGDNEKIGENNKVFKYNYDIFRLELDECIAVPLSDVRCFTFEQYCFHYYLCVFICLSGMW